MSTSNENNLVVVVDDDRTTREILRVMFSNNGYQVVEFKNSKGVYGYIAANKPILALIDIIMPEKEGIETINELRQFRDTTTSTTIITMSSSKDYLDISKELGCDDTILKPLSIDNMKPILAKYNIAIN